MHYIYILLCNNNKFYTGYTNDLKRRLQQHQRSEVKYTSNFLPIKLIHYEKYQSKEDAIKREKQIKGWSRKKKINLIKYKKPNKK